MICVIMHPVKTQIMKKHNRLAAVENSVTKNCHQSLTKAVSKGFGASRLGNCINYLLFEPRFRPGPTQTGLYSHRR